jgi:hypothetical protein
VAPPNPLGLNIEGSISQYTKLKTLGFDVSTDAGQYSFELDAPPLFLDLARQDVGAAWREFVSSEYHSQCLYQPTATKEWAGICKGTMSNFRDALNKFSAIYPPQGSRYKDDPWDTIQEDVAHQGYSRCGNLVDRLVRDQGAGLAYWDSTMNPWIQYTLNTIGEYGDKYIFNDNRNPKWMDYVLLKGSITNEGTPIDSKTPFFPRFGTEALQNKQFWGTDARFGAKEGFDGFENLGLLYRVQLRNAFGEDDKEWYIVMAYKDLTQKLYGSFICELKFHDLRKIIRMMWRTMSDNPQIMPLNWLSATIPCPAGATPACSGGKFPALSASASTLYNLKIGGKSLLKEIFKNSAESKAWLKSLGWDDALIQLATSMALGGYYHVDYFTLDPTITEEMADNLMDSNDITWDFIQRMGYIHDILLDFTLQSGTGASDATLNPIKDRCNALWAKFVKWCDANQMLDLLKYKLDPYFPIGNATADRQLAPALPLSNIPFLVINTHGKTIPCVGTEDVEQCLAWDADQKYVDATMEVYENTTRNPPTLYNISIKAHGESSRQWPKKTFGIKFWNKYHNDTKNVKFVGLKENDEFVMKGLFVDMTLNRDAFAYNISRGMGMWAPRTQQTEMYLIQDNMEISYALHYKGVYTVTESISRGKNRVDIPKNGLDDSTGVDVPVVPGDGGFIFAVDKFDQRYDQFHTMPVTKNQITISYPGKRKMTTEQMNWAWSTLDDFETDMFGPNWLKTGEVGAWDRWIDLDSWAAYFIHAEIMKSVDAYRFSTYFWTEGKNSTIKFGPPWDYDLSSGNTGWVVDLTGQVKQTHSWQYMWALTIATDRWTGEPQSIPQSQHTPCAADWFYRMLDVPEFKNRVESMFWDLRHTILSEQGIRATIAAQKEELKKGSNRNFATWATLDRVDIWPHFPPPIETSWEGKWMILEEFLVGRVAWLEENIYGYVPHDNLAEGTTCDLGVKAPDCLNGFQPFPEPFASCNKDPYIGFWWVRSNWQSNFKFFMNQSRAYNDGSDCSVLEYLHWEATAADPLGPVNCPIPGGPDGLLPPYPPKNAPLKCGGGCGPGAEDMTPSCLGTIQWLQANWKSNPKYALGGVDGSACSCQKFLHQEGKCPKVRGMDGESYCVANRCQRAPGTASPTAIWKPVAPTVKTKPPTNPPTVASAAPTPGGPVVNCGESAVTDAVCHTMQKVKAAPSTACTECKEAECCVEQMCSSGLLAWCVSQEDTGTSFDCRTEDPCQVLKKPVGSHFPVNGNVKCVACDLEECCTNKTCMSGFTGSCPSGKRPRQSNDDGGVGCNMCDESECCVLDIKTCTKANFPMNCSVGSRWVESNTCKGATCSADDCCAMESRKCTETFQMTDNCPAGWRHKNASGGENLCERCDQKECCLEEAVAAPTSSGTAVSVVDPSSGNGGTIAAVVIIILVLGGAAVGFFLWRRNRMSGKNHFVSLNADQNEYKPPATA